MALTQHLTKDQFLLAGWATLLLSAIVFSIPSLTHISPEHYFAFFIFHFGIVIVYHFILYFNKESRTDAHMIHYRIIKLVLLLLSAYALNRVMEVFAASPPWFTVLLVVLCLNYLASAFFSVLPKWYAHLSFFLYGIGAVVFTYMAIYLMPLYIISFPGLLLFGISIHTFIPLLWVIITVLLARRQAGNNPGYWAGFAAGVVATFLVCVAFVIGWDNRVHTINRQYTAAMAEGEDKLPLWVQVAQKIQRDAITEKILKTDLIYKNADWGDSIFWRMPSRNFGDQQQLHDPLVVLATLFSDNVLVPEDDRIKILESQYNARHEALERLWSGENLKTEQVTTQVRVWPQQHMAYTEKLITVYNHQSPDSWRNQEEGIYTFHMPEGAVVSSLSLWIEGKEEKAILTSKQKASTAYRTIVGYERRDPSVVHWQEGNTVSVRVFPVVAGSSRTFKLGITAPLQKDGEELVYENIWFDGPDARKAEKFVKLEVEKEETPVHQASLVPDNQRMVTRTGTYQPRWKASFKDNGLAESSFSFNGYRYYLKPYQRQYVPATITDVYLDINESWTADDFRQIQEIASHQRVWVYNRGFQQLAESNRQELFHQLQKQSFSLFPFHLIKNREHSLVIQKSGSYSPSVSDLAGSPFLKNLQAKLDNEHRIKVFQLGQEMSPFIRSLKERRCFDYEIGDSKLLRRLLKENLFIRDTESDNEIIVHSASVVIVKEAGESATTAPDHVMRLFAYNHIMQQLGRKEVTSADSTAIIKEAEEAYVVSPVSSLIVLETQHDYDRFGIKDSEASLKNASLQNKGAVPEPAEWMMIVLLVTAFFLFVYKTKLV